MAQRNLFEFEGARLVREFLFTPGPERPSLTVTFVTAEDRRRLRFDNPRPAEELLPITQAEQVWIYLEPSSEEGPGGVVTEYWSDGFHKFLADALIDASTSDYDTRPNAPLHATGAPPRRQED